MKRIVLALALLTTILSPVLAAGVEGRWVGAWTTAQQLTEPNNLPPAPGLAGHTLRQVVQLSLGGTEIRLTLSNAFGNGPLVIGSVHVARSADGSAIQPGSDRVVTFGRAPSVRIPPGQQAVSDPLSFAVDPFTKLAITLQLTEVPSAVTGHPGSRTTSFVQPGAAGDALSLPAAVPVDHWYFLSGIDVWADPSAAAIVVLGDSLTDGRGSTTNKNDRWPDQLAHRLAANPTTRNLAVLNQGIGGNRLLHDGLGPNTLSRLDRDVFGQSGVRWLIVFEGINDLGTAAGDRARGRPAASAADLLAGYREIVARGHAHGLRVYGATITPFAGFTMYFTPAAEADRQEINAWIRTSGVFDGVIDFDRIARDPGHPARLAAAVDGGDHLHLSPAGYKIIADGIDLDLFAR